MMEKATGAPHSQSSRSTEVDYKDYAMEAALLEAQQKRQSQGVPGTHEPFPVKLHWVLEQAEKDGFSHIVRWAPHGRAFVVHQREPFVEQVLPVYFNQTKFTSFQRQLSLYGFRRVSKGPERGGYYHPMFLRISRTFTRNITRTKVKNEGPRKAASPDAQPDFYKLPKLSESIGQADTHSGWPQPDRAASIQFQHAGDPREPSQQFLPARLRADSRLALQAAISSPLHSSVLLPIPELEHNRLLSTQLQAQHQQNSLLAPAAATFPSLPSQLPAHGFLSFNNNPPWLSSSSSSFQGAVARSIPTMQDLLFHSSSRTTHLATMASFSLDQAIQAVAYGSQQSTEASIPSPSLSEAIAQILGARNDHPLPPNPSENSDASKGGT